MLVVSYETLFLPIFFPTIFCLKYFINKIFRCFWRLQESIIKLCLPYTFENCFWQHSQHQCLSLRWALCCKTTHKGWQQIISLVNLPMLRLLLSKAQGCNDFWKPSKPCHIGIHWVAPAEYSQMSTHVPGCQSFFSFLHSFVMAK